MIKNKHMNYSQYFLSYWPKHKQDIMSIDVQIKNNLDTQHTNSNKQISKKFALSSGG